MTPSCRLVREHLHQTRANLVPVAGIPFADVDFRDAVGLFRGMVACESGPHHIVLANAYTINLALDDPAYHAAIREGCLVLRDGIGVSIAARLFGGRLRHNFVGTDFVPRALHELASLKPRVFLYGARPGRAEVAARQLQRQSEGVQIAGCHDGYIDPAKVLADICETKPDVLLVALGNPLQEQWIASHIRTLPVRVAIGVGALFDYLAGTVPRAPLWVRRARSEWLYRLAVEPKRLWRRYLLGNPVFLARVAMQAASARLKAVAK